MRIGNDIEEVDRFVNFKRDSKFILNNFSKYEIDYCFNKTKPQIHLCGIFCAKESIIKVLNLKDFSFLDIEIKHDFLGRPIVIVFGEDVSKYVDVSISHSNNYAIATALNFKK